MKFFSSLIAGAIVVSSAHAASYSTNFSFYENGTTPYPASGNVAGNDGWTINGSSIDETSGVSFIVATWISGKAIGVGGLSAPPATPTVGLMHDAGVLFGSSSVSFEFAMVDTGNDNPFRDTFGISLTNASNTGNLFSILFVPVDDSPADPDADDNGRWNLFYQVGATTPQPTGLSIFEGTNPYSFDLGFTANGANTNFVLGIGSELNSLQTEPIEVAVNPNTSTGKFGVTWTPSDYPNAGEGYLLVDNLSVVPEPSSAVLLGLAGFGLLSRRKRH